jgi:hypothetical protein
VSDPQEVGEVGEVGELRKLREENVRSVRLGHGANCSSVGSVIDTLFLGATLGGIVFAAVCAAMKVEGIKVVGARPRPAVPAPDHVPAPDDEEDAP